MKTKYEHKVLVCAGPNEISWQLDGLGDKGFEIVGYTFHANVAYTLILQRVVREDTFPDLAQ